MRINQLSVPKLPDGTVLVHIGPHKTGTTNLQNSMHINRIKLMEQGVYYGAPAERIASNRIARALLRLPFINPDQVVEYKEWEDQVARIKASGARIAVISGEEFSFCGVKEIRTLLSDLGKNKVHIVITVRSLAKILPSQWQLDLKGMHTVDSFDTWLRWVLKPRKLRRIATLLGIPHPFWFRHRHDQLVKRWMAEVGIDKVTVVVADDANDQQLFDSFEALFGVIKGTLQPDFSKSNPSISVEDAAIIAKVFSTLAERHLVVNDRKHVRIIRQRLLTQRPKSAIGAKITIPGWAVDAVHSISQTIYDGLLTSGVRIIGDPSVLLQSNIRNPGRAIVDESATESVALQLVAELEADGKLEPGRNMGSSARAMTRLFRRLTRRARKQ